MKRIDPGLSLLCVSLLVVAHASAQSASPLIKVLFAFPCNNFVCPDGYFPEWLTEGSDGNLYGVAAGGGTGMNAQGTVFKITRSGQFSLLYSFAEQPDGSLPLGSDPLQIIEGIDGFLYGANLLNGRYGEGTIFKLNKSGSEIQDLHDFCAEFICADGANPAALIQGLDSQFYGSTASNPPPSSVLFRISASGNYTVLHTYDTKDQPDGSGAYPFIQATDGNLYGATVAGSQNEPYDSDFRFDPGNDGYAILHEFNPANAATSGLIQAANGDLFGIEANSILYELSQDGYQELGPLSSTQYYNANILQATDGNLWGDFQGGDCNDEGLVFSATTNGAVLQNLIFDCMSVGEQLGEMIQAADGKFYGVTLGNGGVNNNSILNGTIWVLDAGLPPPGPVIVDFAPTEGASGAKVLLQGQHFAGTTSVSFNGVKADFKILAGGYIGTVVPTGATSGKITVTNEGGSTESARSFTVE